MPRETVVILNSSRDCAMVDQHYSDCHAARILLAKAPDLCQKLNCEPSLWIDPGLDSIHRGSRLAGDCERYLDGFTHGKAIRIDGLQRGCTASQVSEFIDDVMQRAMVFTPTWLTLPQLPFVSTTDRNRTKLNQQMARAVEKWMRGNNADVRLVLPVILCERDVLNKKTEWRNKVVEFVERTLAYCRAHWIWVVNTELYDERGFAPNESRRFPGLIDLHIELLNRFGRNCQLLSGPYWAMNIVLWARGLATYPVISPATGFRYHIPGGSLRTPNDRVAIAPLLRRAETAGLDKWLQQAQRRLLSNVTPATSVQGMATSFSKAAAELQVLSRQLGRMRGDFAHNQVASFYSRWLHRIEVTPSAMRALALHQELASAHVVGTIVGDLPSANKLQDAGRLARQYMLSCL